MYVTCQGYARVIYGINDCVQISFISLTGGMNNYVGIKSISDEKCATMLWFLICVECGKKKRYGLPEKREFYLISSFIKTGTDDICL